MNGISDFVTDVVFERLLVADVTRQLPGDALVPVESLTDEDTRVLLMRASILANSRQPAELNLAYEITTRVVEVDEGKTPAITMAAQALLTRIGAFPGRKLLPATQQMPRMPLRLALEGAAREAENTVYDVTDEPVLLTDFQLDLFESMGESSRLSVSAPTSAGKSFVLSLDLIRRMKRPSPGSVVYLAPSRALVRQIAIAVGAMLRRAGLHHVEVRTTPVLPPAPETGARPPCVFVLTQERLLTLLATGPADLHVSALIVDEAQQIADHGRGVVLQAAVERALARYRGCALLLASPLTENPVEILSIFDPFVDSASGWVERFSPVGRNTILVEEVPGDSRLASFSLQWGERVIDLGIRQLPFPIRGSVYGQRAGLAKAVTRPGESTLIYANGAHDAEQVAKSLASGAPDADKPELTDFAEFLEQQIHKDYLLPRILRRGVGFHYGQMPAIVRARIEDLFGSADLRFLCCTSTLLHGVNLPARHLIVESPTTGSGSPMPRSAFVNLAGRAGRLGYEFHGNVWCVRPSTWQAPVFKGAELGRVIPAMDVAMGGGGEIVSRALEGSLRGEERDDGEAALGKFFVDFALSDQDIRSSRHWDDRHGAALVALVEKVRKVRSVLPDEIFLRNFQVHPGKLEELARRLITATELAALAPLSPTIYGFKDRLFVIFRLVGQVLGSETERSCNYHALIAKPWVSEQPIRDIIQDRIDWLQGKAIKYRIDDEVRRIIGVLESGVQFRFAKYVRAYTDVYLWVASQRKIDTAAISLSLAHQLECGAFKQVTIGLITLGLSRTTAIALRRRATTLPERGTLGQLRDAVIALQLDGLKIPAICKREVLQWRSGGER